MDYFKQDERVFVQSDRFIFTTIASYAHFTGVGLHRIPDYYSLSSSYSGIGVLQNSALKIVCLKNFNGLDKYGLSRGYHDSSRCRGVVNRRALHAQIYSLPLLMQSNFLLRFLGLNSLLYLCIYSKGRIDCCCYKLSFEECCSLLVS